MRSKKKLNRKFPPILKYHAILYYIPTFEPIHTYIHIKNHRHKWNVMALSFLFHFLFFSCNKKFLKLYTQVKVKEYGLAHKNGKVYIINIHWKLYTVYKDTEITIPKIKLNFYYFNIFIYTYLNVEMVSLYMYVVCTTKQQRIQRF